MERLLKEKLLEFIALGQWYELQTPMVITIALMSDSYLKKNELQIIQNFIFSLEILSSWIMNPNSIYFSYA